MENAQPSDPRTSDLIRSARAGDRTAVDRLFALAYEELHRLAHAVRGGGAPATLNTTALVHEAYFKLSRDAALDVSDRAHFSYIVARAMRQVLVDAARRRQAEKRGGGVAPVTILDSDGSTSLKGDQILALEEALGELERVDPRRARIVECRFFGGLSVDETAASLGVSAPTVKRDWRVARAWLAQALEA